MKLIAHAANVVCAFEINKVKRLTDFDLRWINSQL